MSISKRCASSLDTYCPEYIPAHFSTVADPAQCYHPETNPAGYIGLAIAENKTCYDLLVPHIQNKCSLASKSLCGYQDGAGVPEFRQALASLLEERIFRRPVDAHCMRVGAGASAIVGLLTQALCDAGDGVIVPRPFYSAFTIDVGEFGQATLITPDTLPEDDYVLTASILDGALEQAQQQNVTVKALILTSPHNPTGRVYSRSELNEILEWVRAHPTVHLIADEVYALSVHDPKAEFVSVGSILSTEQIRDDFASRVHVVYGFSKDFSMSGFRAGVLYSHHEQVLAYVAKYSLWLGMSSLTQSFLTQILNDRAFLDHYLEEMPRRLHASFAMLAEKFRGSDVRLFGGCQAGIFAWLDFSSVLARLGLSEQELWSRLFHEARVNLNPGSDFGSPPSHPGWFRIAFASVRLPVLEVALDRILRLCSAPQK